MKPNLKLAGLMLLVAPVAWAETITHVKATIFGCKIPSIARDINDEAAPRHSDQRWIGYLYQTGHCVAITPASPWAIAAPEENGVMLISYRGTIGPPGSYYVPSDRIDLPQTPTAGTSALQVGQPQSPQVFADALPSPSPGAFEQGQSDRQAIGDWFETLTGDARAGADYWASHRSLSNPGSCNSPPPGATAAWIYGCQAAQQKLRPADLRRKTEPDYRRGWNNPILKESKSSPNDETEPPRDQTTQVVPAPPPADSTSGNRDNRQNTDSPQQEVNGTETQAAGSAQTDTAASGAGAGGSGLTLFLDSVVGIIAAFFGLKFYLRHRDRVLEQRALAKSLEIAQSEVDSQSKNLQIRRQQTLSRDIYGTLKTVDWEKEKDYFFISKIAPLLADRGLSMYTSSIRDMVLLMIEQAACTESLPVSMPVFRSSPSIYDPRMSPIDYEIYCKNLLIANGWDARTTVATGDQGADIIATKDGRKIVVQCKLYSSSIGNDAVQQVFGAMKFQCADYAIVVSNQPYTRSARQLAESTGVLLLHHDHLPSLELQRA